MKLVYLWIKGLNNSIDVDFNLGSDYFFKFNSEINTLQVTDNVNYITDIYNQDANMDLSIDMNAIVGENGTGKTTILEAIRNIVLNKYRGEYLLVYENQDIYTYKAPHKIKIDSLKLNFEVQDGGVPKINSFYYSNVFDLRYVSNLYNYSRIREVKDYTTNILMRKSDNIYDFFAKEFSMQVEFVNQFYKDESKSKFKVPQEVYFRLKPNAEITVGLAPDLMVAIEKITKYEHINKLFFGELSKYKKIPYYFMYSKNIVLYNIFSILDYMKRVHPNKELGGLHTKLAMSIEEIVSKLNTTNLKQEKIFDIVFDFIITKHEKSPKSKIFLEKYDTKKMLNNLKKENKILYSFLYKCENLLFFRETVRTKLNELSNDIIKIFIDFQKMDLGSFEWHNLSSGEYALLSMFSRINHASKQIEKTPNPNLILMLVDEGELYFHPQWQKEFTSILLEYLYKIFESYKVHIQIILTTHSPFILSDLTLDRVLFLQKSENEKVESVNQLENLYHTFGANIHDLYTHSFFLKGSLMGNQAKDIINRLADEIINETPEYLASKNEVIRRKIYAIGEPLLKQKLTLLYEQKLKLLKPTQKEIKNEIEMLKQRLDKLEQLKGELE